MLVFRKRRRLILGKCYCIQNVAGTILHHRRLTVTRQHSEEAFRSNAGWLHP